MIRTHELSKVFRTEEVETTALNNVNNSTNILVRKDGIISKVDGMVEVIAFNGIILRMEKVQAGHEIKLAAGAYIIRVSTNTNTTVQKVVI